MLEVDAEGRGIKKSKIDDGLAGDSGYSILTNNPGTTSGLANDDFSERIHDSVLRLSPLRDRDGPAQSNLPAVSQLPDFSKENPKNKFEDAVIKMSNSIEILSGKIDTVLASAATKKV